MKFKNERAEREYKLMPKRLRAVCDDFETFSLFYGIEPVITRVREPQAGDSGVHEQGRGVDARDAQIMADGSSVRLYTKDQADSIVANLNLKHPRTDGKPTALHHSFQGGPAHIHLQIPVAWLEKGEPLSGALDG